MDTENGVDSGMGVSNLKGPFPIPFLCPNREDILNPRFLRPLDDFFQILFKLRHFEMGVGIDEHLRYHP